MRSWQIALVVTALGFGCSKRKLHWSETRATTFTDGGFTIPIPAGWRNAAEATDEDMQKLVAKQPTAHILVKEEFDGATIVVKVGSNPPTANPACDEIANAIAKQESGTATAIQKLTVEGDGTCQWTYKVGSTEADYWMRFHADKLLFIMCSSQGDKANVATCAEVRQSAHAAP